MSADTSAEAVERLATEVVSSLPAPIQPDGSRPDAAGYNAVIHGLVALDVAATLRAMLAERDAARALLHKALRHADRVSVLLNDIAAEAHRINDERLLALTVRRFSDCSGLDLFIAAEKAGLSARAALAGEGKSSG